MCRNIKTLFNFDPRNREVEAAKGRERVAKRFGSAGSTAAA